MNRLTPCPVQLAPNLDGQGFVRGLFAGHPCGLDRLLIAVVLRLFSHCVYLWSRCETFALLWLRAFQQQETTVFVVSLLPVHVQANY